MDSPLEPGWLAHVNDDYAEGEVTLLYERATRSTTRRLLFAVVELLPPWTGRQPRLPNLQDYACLPLNRSGKEFNLARFHLPVQDALAWYQGLAGGLAKIPPPPPRRVSPHPPQALDVSVGSVSGEPTWPNVVLEGPKSTFWDDCPLWGHRPGLVRRHAFITVSPLEPYEGCRPVDVDKAKAWIRERLPVDITSRPVLWGSAHLILPNPLFLDVDIRRGRKEVPEIIIEVVPRPGAQLDDLSLRFYERRPIGESTPILLNPLHRFNVVRLTDEPRENWLEVVCPYRVRIPGQSDHSFRRKPITDSDAKRSPVPIETDHLIGLGRNG